MNNLNFECRFCSSSLKISDQILNLDKMPLTDNFIEKSDKSSLEYLEDIEIFLCTNCNLVQNPKNFDYLNYYKDYNYSSGHSQFTLNFMNKIADHITNKFFDLYDQKPKSVVEIGSGDGIQLKEFYNLNYQTILGIEPSSYLAKVSRSLGIEVVENIYDCRIEKLLDHKTFDVCISSYTFDHMPNPKEYLETSYNIMSENSLLVIEIHDLDKILQRNEWCLFEHEHTIYLNREMALNFLLSCGFEVIEFNPLHDRDVRANSLIIVAKKIKNKVDSKSKFILKNPSTNLNNLQESINNTIQKIDDFVEKITSKEKLIGFGVGGRGVMTLAALKNFYKFSAIFDTNFKSDNFIMPKTHIPIHNLKNIQKYSDYFCLVFSFGYFEEIAEFLKKNQFSSNKIISLGSFFNN